MKYIGKNALHHTKNEDIIKYVGFLKHRTNKKKVGMCVIRLKSLFQLYIGCEL